MSQTAGVKLFVHDIRPFNDINRTEAVADTLLKLANFGLMMRTDTSRVVIQHLIGSVITSVSLDMLGDLYVLNGMPVEARLTGQYTAENVNSRTLLSRPDPGNYWNSFYTNVLPLLGIFAIIQPALIVVFLIAIIAIIILILCRNIVQVKTSISERIAALLFGVMMTLFFFIGTTVKQFFLEPYLIISGSLFVVGLGLVVFRLVRRRKTGKLSGLLPIVLMSMGIIGALCALTQIIQLAYLGFSLFVFILAYMVSKKSNVGLKGIIPYIARITAELFAFFALIMIILWLIVAGPMTKFMNLTTYNMMIEFHGPQALLFKADYSRISHYNPVPDMENPSYAKRIARLEEMFGEIKH